MNFGDFERPLASPKKAFVSAAGLLADLASRSSWTLSRGQFELFLDEAAASFGAQKSSLRDDFASNRLVRGLDAQTPPRPLAFETASGTWALSPFAIARLAAANWRERLPPAAARTLLDACLLRLEAALPPGQTLLRACVGGSLARSLLADPSAPPDFGDVDLALSFSVDGSIVGEADLSPQRRSASELRWAAHGAPLAKLGLSSDPDERSYLDDPKPIGIHAIAWLGPKAVVFDARAGGRFAVPEPFFGPIPALASALASAFVSVNVSVKQFRRRDFIETLCSAIAASGCDGSKLRLEITEEILHDDFEATVSKMESSTLCGPRFALDDFGSGSASISNLQRFPFETIKLDQNIARGAANEHSSSEIVRSVVSIAHGLRLAVVAEGVETLRQFDFLRGAGCTLFQGNYFGEPAPLSEISQFLLPSDSPAPDEPAPRDRTPSCPIPHPDDAKN